jgi:diamine N-acetyltransferase
MFKADGSLLVHDGAGVTARLTAFGGSSARETAFTGVPWPYDAAMISLRPIDESNREAVEALEVSPEQQRFVSNAADSIREAAREPDGRALYWAIYADETPVGFVMISNDVGSSDYFPQYLWKLFIDERYQDRGYGTATLDLIADYFRQRPEVEVMRTSCGQGKGSPLGFYERYGFDQTGEIVFDNEILLQLKLR